MQTVQLPYRGLPVAHLAGQRLTNVTFEQANFAQFIGDALDPDHILNRASKERDPLVRRLDRENLSDAQLFEEYLEKGWAMARGLRHAGMIHADLAALWICNAVINDPLRLHWHIRRLDGIGPSSAYAYVAEMEGKRSFFTTARELEEIRLMMRQPGEQTAHTFRGTVLEDLNRRLLYSLYSKSFVPDPEGYRAVSSVQGTPDLPWLRGNPDDLAFLIQGGQRYRALLDFKCPSERKNPDDLPQEEYEVQLHLYDLQAKYAQHPAAAVYLSHLYIDEGIAQMWAGMIDQNKDYLDVVVDQAKWLLKHRPSLIDLALQPVEIKPDLQEKIIRACNASDERVQRGLVSPYPRKPMLEMPAEQLEEAQLMEPTLARAIAMDKAIESHSTVLKKRIAAIFADVELTGMKQPLPLLGIKKVRKLDVEKAVDALRAAGIDTTPLERTDISYDTKELRKALEAAEIPADLYEKLETQVGFTASKSGPAVARVQELKDSALLQCQAMFPIPAVPAPAPVQPVEPVAPEFMKP